MLKLLIQGLKDGETEVQTECDAELLPFSEVLFFGKIKLAGKLRKIGKRLIFNGKAIAAAKLTCDLTLKEYIHEMSVDVVVHAIIDSNLARIAGDIDNDGKEIALFEDEKYLDLSDEVRELLELNLPMRRIHPDFIDKSLEDVFPEFSVKNRQDDYESPFSGLELKIDED
jgi:uncharacterized metal-binding protein YceD (DUF177 family)